MAIPKPEPRKGYEIRRPNRDKAASKSMKAVVLLLLVASIALMVIVTLGGWSQLTGMRSIQIAYVVIYVIFFFFVARWNRGVLPMIAALAIVLAIFAAVAGPEWFARDKTGYAETTLAADLLGLLTFLLVPVQLLLVGASVSAFAQGWSVEVEVPEGETYDAEIHGDGSPATA